MATAATIATTRTGHEVATMTGHVSQASTEAEIVAAAQQGDHEAFRLLVDQQQGRVHALCMRILRDPEWARDAAQEAFLKAYRNIRRFEGRSAFGTWMYRLTYNHCLDLTRWWTAPRGTTWTSSSRATGTDSSRCSPLTTPAPCPPSSGPSRGATDDWCPSTPTSAWPPWRWGRTTRAT